MSMSAKQKSAYLADQGLICPYCECNDLKPIYPISFSGGDTLIQPVLCKNCGEEWKDIYTLAGVED